MKTPKFKKPTLSKSTRISTGMKPPKFASDLYADLRDRRLLPLVALLVVGIFAVPVLLSKGGSDTPAPPPTPISSGATQTAATFSVVPARRELREYRKRLKLRKAKNPFTPYIPKQTKEEIEELANAAQSTTSEETTTTTTTEFAGGATTETTSSPQPVVKATVKANVGVAAKVKVGFVGAEGPNAKPESIEEQTRLPNQGRAALVYVGQTKDGTGGLFLMSTEVSAFYGEGRCVLGPEPCQELELLPGESATFALGFGETRYKVTLVGFAPVIKEATVHSGG